MKSSAISTSYQISWIDYTLQYILGQKFLQYNMQNSKTLQWKLVQFSKPVRDFFNLILVFNEISPRYSNDKNKVLFSTVVNWGCFMNNLSTNILKWLLIKDKEYPFCKKTCFKKLSFLWNLVQSEEICKQQ